MGGRGQAVYVGGLADGATEAALHAAFVPFGEVRDVKVPLDPASGQPRGFGFVEFAEEADAAEAIFNMHNGELLGRTLTVNKAQAARARRGEPEWEAPGGLGPEAGEGGGGLGREVMKRRPRLNRAE